jgi:N-acetylglucosaminyl-diphospho-decaprenol L-rhamnosyltransferase
MGATDGQHLIRQPTVTVAIVSWNTRDLLGACLASLRSAVEDEIADVWVFDNASTDGSAEMVRRDFPQASLIASRENLGFGAGVNAIAARTRTPWLVAANADVAFAPGALETLIQEAEAHPEAGALAPRLILPDGSTQHSAYAFPTIPYTLAFVTGLGRLSRRLARRWCIGPGFDPDEAREVPWAVGAALLVRRDAWDQVGGFDDAQWMYAEDLDLGWRLRRAGWRTRYVPGARVAHAESAATAQAWGDSRSDRWHQATYSWIIRRHGLGYARAVAAINVAGFRARAASLRAFTAVGSTQARRAHTDAMNAAGLHRLGLQSGANDDSAEHRSAAPCLR